MNALLEVFAAYPWLLIVCVAVISLMVGSFLNVVIHRLPLMLERQWKLDSAEMLEQTAPDLGEPVTLAKPRSRCPHCGHMIRAHENVPVLSYLLLRGRCAGCGARISLRYPFVELLTAVASAVVAWKFGLTLYSLGGILLTWLLIPLIFIDFDYQLLPDNIVLPGLWLGLFFSLGHVFVAPSTAIIGAIAGYLSLWSVYHLFRLVTGKEGMGYGDFKLLALLGAWLGWQMLPLIVLLSSLVGAVLGLTLMGLKLHERGVPMPFGPFLAIAGWVAMLWGHPIMRLWLQH